MLRFMGLQRVGHFLDCATDLDLDCIGVLAVMLRFIKRRWPGLEF